MAHMHETTALSWQEHYYEIANADFATQAQADKKLSQAIGFVRRVLTPGSSVLDVGCGMAGLADVLPDGVAYTGQDASPFAVRTARARLGKGKTVVLGDLHTLSFPDQSFNLVWARFVLEHLSHPREALLEMIRVLKPGGHLLIIAPNLEFPFAYPTAVRHKPGWYRYYFYLVRLGDYLVRLCGVYRFRTLRDNFLSATGRYELKDDDLVYLSSTYEVVHFLRRQGLSIQYIDAPRCASRAATARLRHMLTCLPGLAYWGTELFLIARKTTRSS